MNISQFSQKPNAGATYAKNEVPAFVITTQNTILAQLNLGNEVVFKGIYAPDFSGQISIDFKGLYDDYLKTLIPTTGSNELTHTEYRRQFTATFYVVEGEDISGDPATRSWYVANAKLKSDSSFNTWGQSNFLTNQPLEKTTNYEAPEWLTWWDNDGDHVLVARFYPKSGGTVDVTVKTDSAAGVFSANVRYSRLIQLANVLPNALNGYYDLILFDAKNSEITRQRYIYRERTGFEKYFLFVNALGGIDTLICNADNVLQPEATHNVGRFAGRYRALDDTDDSRKWQQSTGMVPNLQRDWIFELLTAKQGAEKYDPVSMKYLEIVVNTSDVSMSDFGQLSSAAFGYILTDPDNVVTDSERPDRSLHKSVAEAAQAFDDLSWTVTAVFLDDGNNGFETEELEIPATKIYVTDPRQIISSNEAAVYYYLNESVSASGSFTPGVSANPYVITKQKSDTIRFATQDSGLGSLEISYYPGTNNQSV
jgi:hypothetical protein